MASEAAVVAVDSTEEALEAVVAVHLVATEAAEEAEEEVHVADQEADQQDPQCLSDKDRSNAYEEAHHHRLPEIYEKARTTDLLRSMSKFISTAVSNNILDHF